MKLAIQKAIWDWEHEKIVEGMAHIKVMLDQYRL
jgi:hypothetical protein